jgi:hypothetical protein
VGSGLAGFAILVAMLLAWWLASGNGPGGPPGSASRLNQPGAATAPATTAPSAPPRTVPRGLPLVTWEQEGTTLRLTYRRGDDDCFGGLDTPRVRETDVAVEITLLRRSGAPASCPFTTTDTALVDLDGPVGDRSVLDGAYVDRRVRVRPAS